MCHTFYKYFSLSEDKHKDRISDLLLRNQIYLSNSSKFNDPFDRPHISFDVPHAELLKKINHLMGKGNIRIDKHMSPANRIKEKSKLVRLSKSTNFVKKFLQNIVNDYSVMCLSKKNNDILMWSHYADSHQGICIGFKRNYLEEYFEYIFKIKYEQEYPKVSIVDTDQPHKILDAFSTKYTTWEYEQEIRVANMHPARVVTFSDELIESVYLGSEISNSNEKLIFNLLKQRNQKIYLYKASKDVYKFKLDFDSLNY